MSDIITTLHPENDESTNLYPNIKKENIPDDSIDESKLSKSVNDTLDGIDTRLSNAIASIEQPKYYSTLPTSDVGLIVYSDGYIYSWNGSAYTSTNISYQAIQTTASSIGSGSLERIFKYVDNLITPSNINLLRDLLAINGKFINPSNGNTATNANYSYYDYIEINPNTEYLIVFSGGDLFGAYYDENNTFISGIQDYSSSLKHKIITTPSTAKYIRLSQNTDNLSNLVLCHGTDYTFTLNNIVIPNLNTYVDSLIIPNAINIYRNRLDKIDGKFINPSNGNTATNANYSYYDYTEITPSTTYYGLAKNSIYGAYYTENNTFIESFRSEANGYHKFTTTSPSNAKFMRVSFETNTLIDFALASGDYPTCRLSRYIRNEYTVGKTGNEDFSTLKSAIEYINNNEIMNAIINVGEGTYDIQDEFGGSTYFDNNYQMSNVGLILKNGVHLKFATNSKVIFNYEGSNNDVAQYFSPFNSGKYGFTLENCTMICKNSRYCVHDERVNQTDTYVNKYINCSFTTENVLSSSLSNCIGGGLGHDGYIEIIGCKFYNVNGNNNVVLSYHNNASSTDTTAKSNVIIKDNYIGGKVRLNYCGVSTAITDIIFTNNSYTQLIHSAEREQDIIDNINIIEWNNNQRS